VAWRYDAASATRRRWKLPASNLSTFEAFDVMSVGSRTVLTRAVQTALFPVETRRVTAYVVP
jgi:hypothetical protein